MPQPWSSGHRLSIFSPHISHDERLQKNASSCFVEGRIRNSLT